MPPAAATATDDDYDRWDDAVLAWGRGLYDQVGRLADWVAANVAPAAPKP